MDVISLVDTPRQIITGASHSSLGYLLIVTSRTTTTFDRIEFFETEIYFVSEKSLYISSE